MAGKAKAASKPRTKKAQEVVAVKGFDPDFKCLGFQYRVGETYEHNGPVRMCSTGFHCIDGNPLDVLDYYPLLGDNARPNRFATVIASGEIARDETSKICVGRLTVSAELKIPDLVAAAVKYVLAACKAKAGENVQAASGGYSKLAASGGYSKLAASGDYSQLAASGDSSKLAASGKNSVIAASAHGCTASGADGTWISLAEFDRNGKCVGFATGCIGKDGLKPDTPYYAKDGKLVAA